MAEVPNTKEAESVIALVAPQIKVFAGIRKHIIEQYWKISAYQEITLYLQPLAIQDANTAYDGLVALAQGGWTHGGDEKDGWSRWSVWNSEQGFVLLLPSIRWAELSLWTVSVKKHQARHKRRQ